MRFICLTIRAVASCSSESIFGAYTPPGILQQSGFGPQCWVCKEPNIKAALKYQGSIGIICWWTQLANKS